MPVETLNHKLREMNDKRQRLSEILKEKVSQIRPNMSELEVRELLGELTLAIKDNYVL